MPLLTSWMCLRACLGCVQDVSELRPVLWLCPGILAGCVQDVPVLPPLLVGQGVEIEFVMRGKGFHWLAEKSSRRKALDTIGTHPGQGDFVFVSTNLTWPLWGQLQRRNQLRGHSRIMV